MKKKHFHHKPTYSGDLTGAILNNASPATVSGQAVVTVLNRPHDCHWHVENPPSGLQTATYQGLYGTLVIDHNGNWTYTLNEANTSVSGLATSATLTDSIFVRSEYSYRDTLGTHIVITITGH